MTGDRTELKARLVEATRRFENAGDLEEKALLGADVREIEKLVEMASDEEPDAKSVSVPFGSWIPAAQHGKVADIPITLFPDGARMPRHSLPTCPKCRRPLTFSGRTVKIECSKCEGIGAAPEPNPAE
jgi:hypothetical protein